jgi:hypothetical protein
MVFTLDYLIVLAFGHAPCIVARATPACDLLLLPKLVRRPLIRTPLKMPGSRLTKRLDFFICDEIPKPNDIRIFVQYLWLVFLIPVVCSELFELCRDSKREAKTVIGESVL